MLSLHFGRIGLVVGGSLCSVLAHEPQAVALDHRHDYLFLGAVAINEGEEDICCLRLVVILIAAYAHAVDALVALMLITGVLLEQCYHLSSIALGHRVGLEFALVEGLRVARCQAVVVDLGRARRQFALVCFRRLVPASTWKEGKGEQAGGQEGVARSPMCGNAHHF